MPKISIIIPVYNSENYLKKCLDSVFSQTFDDYEVIIVNDGSPDGSQAIIDRYLGAHPDRIIALQQENAGQAAARNKGFSLARGEYVFFVDSDDYLHREALQKAYSHAVSHDLDIVCFQMFQDTAGVITQVSYRMCHNSDPVKQYILNEASPCNKLIRKSVLADNGLCFSVGRIYEDLELIPQLARYTNKIGFIDDYLYYYVIHQDSTMRQKAYNPKLASIYPVMEQLNAAFLDTPYVAELEYLYVEHLLHSAVLRYLQYPEGVADICKISGIMRSTFPKWRKNPYVKALGWKYNVICTLAYYKQIRLLKYVLRIK